MAVQIVKQDLIDKVQEGWKKKALADHYGLPVMQMTKVLKDLGLTIRKFHEPKYVLVDEVAQVAQEAVDAITTVDAMIEIPTVETTIEPSNTIEPAQTVQAGW